MNVPSHDDLALADVLLAESGVLLRVARRRQIHMWLMVAVLLTCDFTDAPGWVTVPLLAVWAVCLVRALIPLARVHRLGKEIDVLLDGPR